MSILLTFLWVILGFAAMAFWEAYIEGLYPWAGRQCGWTLRLGKKWTLTAYHFWLNIMFLFFLSLPLVIYGWDLILFGILLSALMIGLIVEDFLWYIVNPYYSLRFFNENDANWYPWIGIGKAKIPFSYIVGIIIALLSWYFIWRI